MVLWDQDPAHLRFVERLTGIPQNHPPGTATWLTSADRFGRVLGVAVFSRFSATNCEISVAGENPRFISKTFAQAVAGYVFGQCKLRRVTAIIAEGNEKSLNLARRLGFREEGKLRHWFPSGANGILLGLLREECDTRFFKDFDGQVQDSATT
jgi:RimJ/RimL family protein N-acetyltransferase